MARKYLRQPIVVTVGKIGEAGGKIRQKVLFVKENAKVNEVLAHLSDWGDEARVIVFVNQKKTADQVARGLDHARYRYRVLHSGKQQEQRSVALDQFKAGDCNILIATDVAGRGIDVPDVSHVINYDMPTTIEGMYVSVCIISSLHAQNRAYWSCWAIRFCSLARYK